LITNTTPTTSPSSGALVVSGGVGVGGGIYANGVITATNVYVGIWPVSTSTSGGSAASASTATTATNLAGGAGGSIPIQSAAGQTAFIPIGTAGYILSSNGTTATWISTGSLATSNTLFAGTYSASLSSVNGAFSIPNQLVSNTGTGSVTIIASPATGSASTWTFGVTGGLTFPDNTVQTTAYTGGGGSASTGTTSSFLITNITPTNSPTTGALVVTGGVGVGGGIYSGGVVTATNVYVGIWPVSTSTVGGSSSITGTNSSFLITNQTNATSTQTGALVVSGGAGFYKDLWIGGTLYVDGIAVKTTGSTLISSVSTASNIGGGSAGSLLIQSASGTTAFIPIGTSGYILQSYGTTATWAASSSVIHSQLNLSSLKVSGLSTFTNTLEILDNVGSVSGSTTLSYTAGQTYYVTPSATWSIAFTNVPTDPANYSTILTVVVNQGSTPYTATSITINGSAVTPKWANGTPWSGNANHTDVVSYGVLNLAGTFNVVAQYSTFA
jgi:hypothetical protein